MSRKQKKTPVLLKLWVSVFGIGYISRGAGTVASIFALLPAWFLYRFPLLQASIIILIIFLSIWAIPLVQKMGWEHDDRRITVDELCGMLLALLWLPYPATLAGLIVVFALGFAFFRILDIFKPPPVNWAERLPAGWGVMADDVLAGLLANLLLRLVLLIPLDIFHG